MVRTHLLIQFCKTAMWWLFSPCWREADMLHYKNFASTFLILINLFHDDKTSLPEKRITLSEEENLILHEKSVAVAGCGGLGGNIIEQLARIGVGNITAIDGDVFDESNLNRQLLSNEANIGKPKALVARQHITGINSDTNISAHHTFINHQNAGLLLNGCHVICDALDNARSRSVVFNYAAENQIPVVSGAIGGWYGKVMTFVPGKSDPGLLNSILTKNGIEKKLGNPVFTATLTATIQVAEVIKILISRGELFTNGFLMIDIFNNDFEFIRLV